MTSSRLVLLLSAVCLTICRCDAFSGFSSPTSHRPVSDHRRSTSRIQTRQFLTPQNDEEVEQIEEARLNIWKSRRKQVRSMLKAAESLRNFRLAEGFVPELDEEGKPIKSDGKSAVTLTAFALAAGAIVLRIGGRAALVSAVGLDFLTDNPELQGQVNQVLEYTETMNPLLKAGLFSLAWTGAKVFCFDAAGIVLALSSGILFGGVFQGTIMSAFGATVGSSVAFALAKADTPVRKKALEVVQDNPSLRGVEKVVAEEGLKAVLTLRLAPILPIPLGLYNYVYGISNVKYFDFAGGIFLGSLKPYLLDSYLGYFGKTLVDGTAGQDGGLQDYILIGVLGFSVLIGVFASQLASETFDAVLQEQKAEEEAKGGDDEDDVITEVFGKELPQWMVGFQYALGEAEERMTNLMYEEFEAKIWNCTETENFFGMEVTKSNIPDSKNPSLKSTSPETTGRYKGVDMGASTCDGLVLSPLLFSFFLQIADPLFDEEEFLSKRRKGSDAISGSASGATVTVEASSNTLLVDSDTSDSTENTRAQKSTRTTEDNAPSLEFQTGVLLNRLQALRDETQQKLDNLEKQMAEKDSSSSTKS
jgi:uncharacterized membrane protein YdjX (TVP38/TMEM64 family)